MKNAKYTKSAEEKRSELESYAGKLTEGIAKVRTSEGYKGMLRTMSSFHNYSFNNIVLIWGQNPDASYVCGFSAWKKLGRYVKKGEKGIRILAPIKVKKDYIDDEGEEKTGYIVKGYRTVSVFDVSQTDGEPLNFGHSICATLEGNVEGYEEFFAAIEKAAPFPVSFEDMKDDDIHGYCNAKQKKIALANGMSELQTINTLIHETAHAMLHGVNCEKDTDTRELEAESVAYIVCQHFGIETQEKSFGYVATWTQDMSDEQIAEGITAIQKTAGAIIGAIESALENENKEAA